MIFSSANVFGQMIRFHRKKSGLTQKELGKLAQLGKTVVFDLEKGKVGIKVSTLLKILEVLNIRIDFQSPLISLFEEQLNAKGQSVCQWSSSRRIARG